MKKIIRIIYLLIIAYILLVLFSSFDKTYFNFRKFPIIPNIISGLISGLIIFLLLKIKVKLDDKKYKIILLIAALIVFILQIIILMNTYFYTDWDVKAIRDAVLNNNIKGNYYLTKYPNTLLYLSIIKFYYNIPLVGKYYFPLLMFNALLVNLSGIVAALVIRKFTNNTYSIIGYIIMSLLVSLSPWINIPYSDTFVILIPITIIYLYTKDDKKTKDYFLIGFLSILGYYISCVILSICCIRYSCTFSGCTSFLVVHNHILIINRCKIRYAAAVTIVSISVLKRTSYIKVRLTAVDAAARRHNARSSNCNQRRGKDNKYTGYRHSKGQ